MEKISLRPILEILGILVIALVAIYLAFIHSYDLGPNPGTSPDTSAWKTYSHSEFGFSIQYPPSWHSEECKDSGPEGSSFILVTFGDKDQLVICNSDAPLNGYVTIGASNFQQDDIRMLADRSIQYLENTSVKDVSLDGTLAIRVEGTAPEPDPEFPLLPKGTKQIIIFAKKENVTYQILHMGTFAKDYADEFDEAIATFRFTK